MIYKTVYEVISDALRKPTRLVGVDKVNNVTGYTATQQGQVFIPEPHVRLMITKPRIAKMECFKTGYENPLRERVVIHENMDSEEFDKKLSELKTITQKDIDSAFTNKR